VNKDEQWQNKKNSNYSHQENIPPIYLRSNELPLVAAWTVSAVKPMGWA